MDEDKRKEGERVHPKPKQQTDEEIESYWSPERQEKAQPIPLPTVDPSKQKKKALQPPSPEDIEETTEPRGPDE